MLDAIKSKLEDYGVVLTEEDDKKINNIINDIKLDIIIYCNLKSYPEDDIQLDSILKKLCVFNFLKSESLQFDTSNLEEDNDNVKSISVGDVSISYGDTQKITDDYINNETENCMIELNKFRRIRW